MEQLEQQIDRLTLQYTETIKLYEITADVIQYQGKVLKRCDAKLDKQKEKIAKLKEQNMQLNQDCLTKLKAADEKVLMFTDWNGAFEHDNAQYKTRNAQLKAERDELAKTYEDSLTDLQDMLVEMKRQNQDAKSDLTKRIEQGIVLKQHAKRIEVENIQLAAKNAELKAEVEKLAVYEANSREAIRIGQDSLKKLETEKYQLKTENQVLKVELAKYR